MMLSPEVDTARDYAIRAHGAQMYGSHPYAHHLDAVATVLAPYGPQAQIVGYLHDVVEDTETSLDEVCEVFGPLAAACVALLTDQPGANRKERKARTYAKLAGVNGPEVLALVVKAADRLSNVRACVADSNARLWGIYRSEHEVFKQSAYRPGLCDGLWAELDQLLDEARRPGTAAH